jgi:nicotinate-nucleotide pyrophosphorylase (carboxylating)
MTRPAYATDLLLQQFIDSALQEDIGEGDHSSLGALTSHQSARARLLVKANGIIAGVELAQLIFQSVDGQLQVQPMFTDGQQVVVGDVVLTVKGNARSILASERLVLNCMQRMSGIATYTSQLCKLLEGTKARIMDTRKTTPNFRLAEKWAVAIGGGLNHRFALYDMVMLKDNHVDMAGGIQAAISNTRQYLKRENKNLRIEIETRTLKEVEEVLAVGGVDVIMLDNMSLEEMRQAVQKIAGRFKTEASGGITEAALRQVADTGVDYISVGALTHSAKSLDLSLKVF